jgi:colanic acid/amylovoran biosynthesis protein
VRDIRRILLVNAWHDDNKGDAAIALGILELIYHHIPDANVALVSLNETGEEYQNGVRHVLRERPQISTYANPLPTELRGDYSKRTRVCGFAASAVFVARTVLPAIDVLIRRTPAGLRAHMQEADLVIGVGGANLYDDPSVHPVLSGSRLISLGLPVLAAHIAGKRTILLGHTLGPFPRRAGRVLARRLLCNVELAVVREDFSAPVARDLGIERVEVAPDMAFAVSARATALTAGILAALTGSAKRNLGIAIRTHPSLNGASSVRFVSEVELAVRSLYADGLIDGVVIVAHTMGPIEVEDDRNISRELAHNLADLPVRYVDEDLSPSELSFLYGELGAVLAVRLHAAILALSSGTPVFAISYFSRKTEGVMNQVGLGKYVAEYDSVVADTIAHGLTALLKNPRLRSSLEADSVVRRDTLLSRSESWLKGLENEG